MRVYIYPYHQDSTSAREISQEMGILRLRRTTSSVRDAADLLIINWGATRVPYELATIINQPGAVAKAASKSQFFVHASQVDGLNIPAYTNSWAIAEEWIKRGKEVCSRSVLSGNSGEGLVISNNPDDHPKDAPLYTEYLPKYAEYRVHVVDGKVIETQRKVWPRSRSTVGVNWKNRSFADGFVFQSTRQTDLPSNDIHDQAIKAVAAVGLDFGGVDVIWNRTHNRATVLEVNTAPGIEDTDLSKYRVALNEIIRKYA